MVINNHEANQEQFDHDIRIADHLGRGVKPTSDWAVQVRDAMPDWGFEIHCIRWLEGLDAVLRSMREQVYHPSYFGRYGDYPGSLLDAVEKRAIAVAAWLRNQPDDGDELQRWVAQALGHADARKREAAQCFVEIAQAFVEDQDPEGSVKQFGKAWRSRANGNGLLASMFYGEGLDRGLFGGASYWALQRLDVIMRIIGSDTSDLEDIKGSCNWALRKVLRDDPTRMHVTLGYLWGVSTFLGGKDVAWLREHKPRFAGAAIQALHSAASSGASAELMRWLAAAFFVTTRFWYQRALIFAQQKDIAPAHLAEVPAFPTSVVRGCS